MEVGRVKAVATICLVFLMIAGQPSAASKCYDDCYASCLPVLNTPMKCDIKCRSECGGLASSTLIHSCKTNCASKFCSSPKLEATKGESCVEGCSKMCSKSHLLP